MNVATKISSQLTIHLPCAIDIVIFMTRILTVVMARNAKGNAMPCMIRALLLMVPALASGEEPKTTSKQQYQALINEYATASDAWSKKYDDGPASDDLVKRYQDWPGWSFAPRFVRLADDHPEDSAALDALLWVVALDRSVDEDDKALLPLYEHAQTSSPSTIFRTNVCRNFA